MKYRDHNASGGVKFLCSLAVFEVRLDWNMDFIQRGQVIETFDDWMDLFFSGFLSIYMGRLGNEVELLDLRLKIE